MKKFTKKETVALMAEHFGMKQKDASEYYDFIMALIKKSLLNDEVVDLYKIGKLVPTLKEKRNGYNPVTKEPIIIPEKKVIKFKISSTLKKELDD